MSAPRAYTTEEVKRHLIEHLWTMISYWEREPRAPTAREKMEGLTHSILAALDGCAMELPAFKVAPSPHPSDQRFHEEEGSNWYPTDEPDIGGSLHEEFYSIGRELGLVKP